MSRKDRARGARAAALAALLEAGDHRGAAGAARHLLADASATPEDRAAAEAALVSLRPEPFAVRVGLASAVAALAVLAWTILRA